MLQTEHIPYKIKLRVDSLCPHPTCFLVSDIMIPTKPLLFHRFCTGLGNAYRLHCMKQLSTVSTTMNYRSKNLLQSSFVLQSSVSERACVTHILSQVLVSRGYAKKAKENKKEALKKGRTEKPHVSLTDIELNQVIPMDKVKSQMQATLDHLQKEYVEQLTVHMTLGVLGNLAIETKDGNFPLIQLGQVVQKSPQLLMINLAAAPQHIPQVKLAVIAAGLNPQQDGTMLFVPVPKVTREHRETLAKNAKVISEKTKEKLRNIQSGYVRDLKKAKDEHSADLIFNLNEHLLSTTKEFVERVEEALIIKQKELLGQ